MSRSSAKVLRTDVQGLRAVAVGVVVASHAGLPGLDGGFVGVDVFFVISGFLISQLLFRQVRSGDSGLLREFYSRRARRILPAATLVTVVTVVASVLVMAVVQAREVVEDAWWATFFAANVRFASVGTDYFAQGQAESPLQHYWSLAVEEQFYFVWPLVLLLVCALGRGWRTRWVAVVLTALGAASFGYGLWLTSHDPVTSYFSTPARAWELGVGALAALVAPRLAPRSRRVQAALCTAGLVAIGVACLTFDATTPMPGVAAAVPVLGSAAVLLAGAAPTGATPVGPARLLSVRPLQVVGDWSYSLYLWHWPLLVLPAAATGESLPVWARLAAVVAAVGLAGLTYRFVETPWRQAPRGARRRSRRLVTGDRSTRGMLLYPTSVALVAVTCLTAAGVNDRDLGTGPPITVDRAALAAQGVEVSKDPTVALVQASVVAARDEQQIPATLRSDLLGLEQDIPDVGGCDYDHDDERDLCPEGAADGDRTIVVLGNSHGRMWIPAFERIARQSGFRTYYLVKPSCATADITSGGQPSNGNAKERWPACDDFRAWALDRIADLEPDLVVVSNTPPGPYVFDDDGRSDVRTMDLTTIVDAYARTFERLEASAGRVVLLRDVPRMGFSAAECLTSRDADLRSCLGAPDAEREELTETSVAAAADVGVEVVDPRPWLCWDGACPSIVGDYVVYRDYDHLTTAYAEELGDDLGRALGVWEG